MFRRLLGRVATAVLAAGVALGTAGTASAQHNHGGGHAGGGHAGGGHAVIPHAGGFGGGRAVIPHAAYGGAYRGGVGTNYHNAYRGQSVYHGGAGANYYHNNYHGGHNYYRGGYGYYRPGYGGDRNYYPYSRFGVGIALGGLGFGYGYPYSYGYSYPSYYYGSYAYPYDYVDSTAYSVPDYVGTGVAVAPTTAYYPPAEPAPAPVVGSSARITVQVPLDAKLWIDGQPTTQTGSIRYFETPTNLEPGRTYSYKLTAEWAENGQTVVREREITFQPGNQAIVNMAVP